MDPEQFLNLLATSLGAVGSVYVLKSLISLSPDLSAKLAATYFDYSKPQIESLAHQRGESIAGALAVVLALCIAVANSALGIGGPPLFASRAQAVGAAAVAVGVLGLLMHRLAIVLARHHSRATRRRIVGAYVRRLIDQRSLGPSYIDSVCSYATNLLDITIDRSRGRRSILVQAAAAAGEQLAAESLPPDSDDLA